MYDVLYLDRKHCTLVARGLARDSAAHLARDEARRRRASRMFLAGSASVPTGNTVVIVRSGPGLT